MKKIALTAAAIFVATGAAFAAGVDHYGSNNASQPAAAVDSTVTASITTSDASIQKPLTQGADRNLFGNRCSVRPAKGLEAAGLSRRSVLWSRLFIEPAFGPV